MTTGEKIKQLRKAANLTQTELGDQLGVKKNAVSKWECGRVEDIPASKIKAMAQLFDVPTSYLIDDSPIAAPSLPANIQPIPKMKRVPLIGTIACGTPILAVEDATEFVDAPEAIHNDIDFALECKGDSMINARIFPGDIVYIKQQPVVENGEIAAVLIGEEATLKRVYYTPDNDRITLRACNPLYSDMIYTGPELDDIKILGKAVWFMSRVRI